MIIVELFLLFFLIGLFTIGGGYAMLPIIVEQVVSRGFLSFETITNFVALAEATPGPFAINAATLVGFEVGFANFGIAGALIGAVTTTIAVVIPSFSIIYLIAKYFNDFIHLRWVKNALKGIKAIVIGLILGVAISLIKTNIFRGEVGFTEFDIYAFIVAVVIYILTRFFKKIGPIYVILISGGLGIIFYYLIPLLSAA